MKNYIKKIISLIVIFCFFNFFIIDLEAQNNDKLNVEKKVVSQFLYDEDNIFSDIFNKINNTKLRYYIQEIVNNFPYRETGSKSCKEAGNYIYERFSEMNLTVDKQKWSSLGNIYNPGLYISNNIIATQKGEKSNPYTIVFSAQYDCNKKSPGALDNGAGVAALLTIAEVLSVYRFNHTIKYIAFSGEEQGLLGSYSYVKNAYENNQKILGVINADIIGNNTYDTNYPNLIRAYVTHPFKWMIDLMDELIKSYDLTLEIGTRPYTGNSDDKAFDDYGYAAMQLYQASNNMENIFGTKQDTIELINFSYLTNISKLIAITLANIANKKNFEPKPIIEYPKEDKKYVNNKSKLITLSKGKIKVKGDITIKVDVESTYKILKVEFKLIRGENENETNEGREIISEYIDEKQPFTWDIVNNYTGLYTIRATAYNEYNENNSDEIEIDFIKSRVVSKTKNTFFNILKIFQNLQKIIKYPIFFNYIIKKY